jgi:soluble lytic murein transglycosylase
MTSTMRAVLAAVLVLSVGLPVTTSFAEAKARPAASRSKAKTSRNRSKRPRAVRVAPKPDPGFLARDAYYSGEIEKAYELSQAAGERWIAALAAWRLNNFVDAYSLFSTVATDPTQDVWVRSGAAFWAARASVASGQDAGQEDYFLRLAAAHPFTFYGMIAEAQLGLAPTINFASAVTPPEVRLAEHLAQVGAIDPTDTLGQIIKVANEPAAEVAELLGQVQGFNPNQYPVPFLAPDGGFTVDPALVYALIRQESRFNPAVVSPAGAVGLMQLMPATAAITGGDSKFRNRDVLKNPAVNMMLGQTYLNELASKLVGDDLLMVVAAYNGGPGAVTKTIDRVGWGADPLLMIESLPAKETRDYVEKVVAGYWIYRRQFGQDTPSLAALAAGTRGVGLAFDRSNPGAGVQQVSLTNAVVAAPVDAVAEEAVSENAPVAAALIEASTAF